MQQTKKGFTLIELLVVIAIIGILSAIGLVSLNGAREKARDSQRRSDIAQMNTALALFYDDNANQYPAQTAATPATQADCLTSASVTVQPTAGVAYATVAGAAANLWDAAGVMVTEYLSRPLVPPNVGTGWHTVYCYDTNMTANPARDSYVIYGGMEGAGGGTFFALRADGTSSTTQPPACAATTDCP